MILFAKHNLLKDAPFSHLELVTCRNLLIYFNDAAQGRTMETFHFSLNPGCYLFLGTSESVDGAGDLYAPVSKEHRVFQSRQAAARIAYPVPEPPSATRYVEPRAASKMAPETSQEQENRLLERISFGDLHQQLLEQYAPPSVVVNENYDIVHLSDRAGRFLQVAGGEPSKNLLQLVRPELRLELRAALFQAVQQRANVEVANLKFQAGGRVETTNIHVRPVLRADDTARGFLLVLFEKTREETAEAATKISVSDEPLANRLEEELVRAKAQLRTSVEEYEIQTEELRASNEELQAMNEELRSTAEELETSREELQSVNEELMTVNQELKIKIEKLSISNNDFQNLLNSTDIGTIFLDRKLRVKMFTPTASKVFNLIDADLNRPLADIATKLVFANLQTDIERVLETLQTIEREVETHKGKWYLMRAFPYRAAQDKISGVVVTFIDITERIRKEQAMHITAQNREQQARIFDTTLSSIADFAYTFDRDGRFIYANPPLLDLFGVTLEEITGKTFRELPYPIDLADRMMKQIEWVFIMGKVVRDETPFVSPSGDKGFYEYIFNPIFGEDGAVEVVAGSTRVTTERVRAEEALRESEERYRNLFNSIDEGFCTIEMIFDSDEKPVDYRFIEMNPTFVRQTGLINAAGKTARELVPNLEEWWIETYGKVALTGEAVRFENFSAPMNRWFDVYASRLGDGARFRLALVFTDITQRKQMEIALREREQFSSAVSDASPTLTYIFDLKTNSNLYVNRQIEKLFGYTAEEIKRLGADFAAQLIHPDDREKARRHFERFAAEQNGEVLDFEYRFKLKTGEWRWVRSYDTVFRRDQKGRATEIIGVAMDVTESKRAEAALRESEERYRAMFEQANVGIVQLTINGHLLAPNPGFCKFIGYGEREARRLTVRDITHPEDYRREAELMRELIAGEIPDFSIEKRFLCKSGNIVWGNMTATLVRDSSGEPFCALSVVEDISERKAAEEAGRKSEERLRLLVESASDYAIFTMSLDNRINSWNKGAEKVFGWTESEALGKSGAIIFTPQDRQASAPEQEIKTTLEKGRAPDERFQLRKDGSRFFVSGVMTLLKDAGGDVQGFVKIARDMTDKMKAERDLRDKEILQKLVGAQEDERKRIARDLHDQLGQQLTALRLKLEAMRKVSEDAEICAKIDEMQMIARQIDDDVDFLAWELRPAALDDLGLVAALENYVKEWSRHSGVTAEFYTAGLKKARLAPETETNLYRIGQEALNNVYKHAGAKAANVMLERRGSLIILIVEDDGKGFDVEDKQNRKKGIGLVGIGERAALIGGKIQIESTPKKGTTIYVRIPVEEKPITRNKRRIVKANSTFTD